MERGRKDQRGTGAHELRAAQQAGTACWVEGAPAGEGGREEQRGTEAHMSRGLCAAGTACWVEGRWALPWWWDGGTPAGSTRCAACWIPAAGQTQAGVGQSRSQQGMPARHASKAHASKACQQWPGQAGSLAGKCHEQRGRRCGNWPGPTASPARPGIDGRPTAPLQARQAEQPHNNPPSPARPCTVRRGPTCRRRAAAATASVLSSPRPGRCSSAASASSTFATGGGGCQAVVTCSRASLCSRSLLSSCSSSRCRRRASASDLCSLREACSKPEGESSRAGSAAAAAAAGAGAESSASACTARGGSTCGWVGLQLTMAHHTEALQRWVGLRPHSCPQGPGSNSIEPQPAPNKQSQ